MKVKLTRDHLDYKKGDTVDATPERVAYWERVGLIKKGKQDDDDESIVKPVPKKTASKKSAASKKK